ncbi:MAG: hypothetical protein ACFCD0_06440 [Gemmataceae bacterium]
MPYSYFRHLVLLFLFFLWSQESLADSVDLGLQVPDGFEVTEYADSRLANDIYTLTVDPKGRIVVAGRKYIRILEDTNKDGKADKAIPFADTPRDGAMGLLWEGDTLYVTGDGGLRRFFDKNGDNKADGQSQILHRLKTGGEHSTHAIRRGPDGWLYVLCGNHSGVGKNFAQLSTSPIKTPTAGVVLRFTPDLKKSEIVADGFRNAYGMDFNADGELFTYDSDNERCVSLPWYEPTRLYHVIPGGFHGWLSPQFANTWRCPPYFPDVVEPLATLNRGSPTGVVCYRHTQFPEKYRGGIFALDWTFGKVYFVGLKKQGSSYTSTKEVFLEAVGDNGFAPTGAVVHPKTGDLYLSIGGRGTRGAVYRIRYPNGKVATKAVKRLQPAKRLLPLHSESHFKEVLSWKTTDLHELRRKLTLLARYSASPSANSSLSQIIMSNWDTSDRYLRLATARLLRDLPAAEQKKVLKRARTIPQQLTTGLALYSKYPKEVASSMRKVLKDTTESHYRLAAIRIIQLAFGNLSTMDRKIEVWEGYSPRRTRSTVEKAIDTTELQRTKAQLRKLLWTGHGDVDREASRTLAMLQDDSEVTLTRMVQKMTKLDDPVEQIHYLIVTSRLSAPRSIDITKKTAEVLVGLEPSLDILKANRDRNWPRRIQEVYRELVTRDQELPGAILNHKDFGHPGHVLFARVRGFDRKKAARKFLQRAKTQEDYDWTPQLVGIVSALPRKEVYPLLRELGATQGLQSAVLPILAKSPQIEDHDRFVRGLNSPSLSISRTSLKALLELPARPTGQQAFALIMAWKRLPQGKSNDFEREIINQLQRVSGQKLGPSHEDWMAWLTKTHPQLAAKANNPDGVDVTAWQQRLTKLDWAKGQTGRGKRVFVKGRCASCHSGRQALGPDLQGVTGRFSRKDLFTAILQPNRDVSERYQTTLIRTTTGKLYSGQVIYQAEDGVILQDSNGNALRIAGDQIDLQMRSRQSLMPSGLLDNWTDAEIVDLYAYLKSLGTR